MSRMPLSVLGCRFTTHDVIAGLTRRGFRVEHCITIGPDEAKRRNVPGYVNLERVASQNGCRLIRVADQALKTDADRAKLQDVDIGVLLLAGWSGLVPEWLLARTRGGAYTVHSSGQALPAGRGRKPINWSIILQMPQLITQLFRVTPGIDDGHLVGSYVTAITDRDDALSVHFKNTVARMKLYERYLPELLEGGCSLQAQPDGPGSWFPKLDERSRAIAWRDTTATIDALIRGLTRPFAGAQTTLNGPADEPYTLWRAQPFDASLAPESALPGTIVEVFENGNFLTRTGDGLLLVREFDGRSPTGEDIGRRFVDEDTSESRNVPVLPGHPRYGH